MGIDIERLKGLAMAATPGPWVATDYRSYQGNEAHWYVDTDRPHDIVDDQDGGFSPNHWDSARGERDMKYIAAANPSAVLELIADVEANQHEREVVCANYDQLKSENEDGLAVIRTLKEQLNCYMKDAERYRIIRDERFRPGCLSSNQEMAKYLNEYMICGDNMDALIDAEIAKDSF